MIDVRVPKYVEKNGNATLECNYDLEGDILYSVKWFKDQHEFYQYTPSETHSIKVFLNRSFKVDVSAFQIFKSSYYMLMRIILAFIQNSAIIRNEVVTLTIVQILMSISFDSSHKASTQNYLIKF